MPEAPHKRSGKPLLWILLGLTLALGAVLVLLLTLMDGAGDETAAREADAEEQQEEPGEDPRRAGPPPPRRLNPEANPGPGSFLKTAARHRALLKHVKRDAAVDPWDKAEGDGPKSPVTVAVAANPAKKLHPDVVMAVRALRPKIASCYRRRLRKKPDLAGKIFVSFTLAPKGEYHSAVGKSRISLSKVGDMPLETCVLRALTTFELAKELASESAWHHFTFAMGRGANLKNLIQKRHREEPPDPGYTPKLPRDPDLTKKPPPEPPPEPKRPLEPPPEPPPEPAPQGP